MSKVQLNYSPIQSEAIPALENAINILSSAIDNLQQNSIPGDFYRKTTLSNTIADLKAQRDNLSNLKSWLINSNKNYDSLVDKLENQAHQLPVYQVKRRSNIV